MRAASRPSASSNWPRWRGTAPRAEVLQAEALLERAGPDLLGSINLSRAQRESARADLASAEQAIAVLDTQINQANSQKILAPRDGIVLPGAGDRGHVPEGGLARVHAGARHRGPHGRALDQRQRHLPLLRPRVTDASNRILEHGSPVRIQFEGWPAIQFVGWPSVALGTFGGEVLR